MAQNTNNIFDELEKGTLYWKTTTPVEYVPPNNCGVCWRNQIVPSEHPDTSIHTSHASSSTHMNTSQHVINSPCWRTKIVPVVPVPIPVPTPVLEQPKQNTIHSPTHNNFTNTVSVTTKRKRDDFVIVDLAENKKARNF